MKRADYLVPLGLKIMHLQPSLTAAEVRSILATHFKRDTISMMQCKIKDAGGTDKMADMLTSPNGSPSPELTTSTNSPAKGQRKGNKTMKTQKTTKKVAAKATKKTSPVKKHKVDEHGFREGTLGSKLFKALLKGATKAQLEKIGEKAVGGFLAGIRKPLKSNWPAARSVKWDAKAKEEGIYKIADFKMKKEA
jgi:hypothetical protein